jgi:hypothetical protein
VVFRLVSGNDNHPLAKIDIFDRICAHPSLSFGNLHRHALPREGGLDYANAFIGGFGPEAIAEMCEILDAAFEKLQHTGEPDVVREGIATRIMAAARLGECDSARLLEAALRRPDYL